MPENKWDRLWLNAHLATMASDQDDLGIIENGAIATLGGKIAWVGPMADLPGSTKDLAHQFDKLDGGWILPGFIDCHTHLVFAGDRSKEFQMRLEGASYEAIARSGGGIVSTVAATRKASEADLVEAALPRLRALVREGVTTIEIKSGYGLNLETEVTMLRAAKALQAHAPVDIHTTFLGAHALPPEFEGRADDYIEIVCSEMIPFIAREGLADAVDGFCENIAFSPEQIARVFESAQKLDLRVKLHADQLSDLGGAALAARYGALSADHLEYTSEAGVKAMGAADSVAVLLPGAYYYLGETKKPPMDALRKYRVPMALATDCNPGSSPITSIRAVVNMGCNLFGMTPDEALLATTRNAARALGLQDVKGVLQVGAEADFAYWQISHPNDLCYWFSSGGPTWVVKSGLLSKPEDPTI